jgi:drug/metabolite transporter (DMT)-like permease
MPPDRKPLDALAFGLMIVLCMTWGFNQVTIKLAAPDVSLVMQGGIRSIIATVLVVAWARVRGISLTVRDGTLAAGIAAGVLFGVEFAFVYAGLAHTSAARMIVFVYTAPCWAALGLAWLVPSERLAPRQTAGVLLAFGGVVVAFADGFTAAQGETFRGDLFGLLCAFFWGATTVVIRATSLTRASATKVLFYQVAVSAVLLPLVSLAMGEPGVVRITPVTLTLLAFQSVIVAFASFLVWFWLLTRYFATRLSVLSFLTPFFGVLSGVLFLGERVTPVFLVAALLVGLGIVLVNAGYGAGNRRPSPVSAEKQALIDSADR